MLLHPLHPFLWRFLHPFPTMEETSFEIFFKLYFFPFDLWLKISITLHCYAVSIILLKRLCTLRHFVILATVHSSFPSEN